MSQFPLARGAVIFERGWSRHQSSCQGLHKGAWVITLLCIFVWQVAQPTPVTACYCGRPETIRQGVHMSDAVFAGRVTKLAYERSQGYIITFDVRAVYKGGVRQGIVIKTSDQGGVCGYPFLEGKQYIVYAIAAPGTGDLWTSICTRTSPLSRAPDVLIGLAVMWVIVRQRSRLRRERTNTREQ